jgi:hypothetical protein
MQSDLNQHSKSSAALEVAEILCGIEERLARAWVEKDKKFIEGILADDWSVTDLTGRVLSKTEVLAEVFGSEDRKVVSMQIDDLRVRSFGDWAIVTGRTRAAGEYRGEVAEVLLRFTDVFVFRNSIWQAVVSHATLISE